MEEHGMLYSLPVSLPVDLLELDVLVDDPVRPLGGPEAGVGDPELVV